MPHLRHGGKIPAMKRLSARILIFLLVIGLPASLVATSLFPSVGVLPETGATKPSEAQFLWLVVAAVLVVLMQAGFLSFESASVQPRHAQGVAIKNFLNFLAAGLGYTVIGFGFMFGASWGGHGLFGVTRFPWTGFTNYEFCLLAYQGGLAAVAATIVSSALVERSQILTNVLFSFFVGAVLYPLFGHWAWNPWGDLSQSMGWLREIGFHDFAGSTVVHCVGGFAALAGVIVLGPRKSKPGAFAGNLPLATIGVLFLWIGWIGFNAGSVQEIEYTGRVIVNTNLSAIAAGITAVFYLHLRGRRKDWGRILVGAMGGLVAITAGSRRMEWWEALLVGVGAGALTVEISLMFAHGVFPSAADETQRGKGPRHIVSHTLGTLLGGLVSREVAQLLVRRWGAGWGSAQSLTLAILAFLAGAAGSYYLLRFLRRRYNYVRIDDPVDAIAIHGVAGLFGTLMVGVLGHAPLLSQAGGVAVAILWSFVLAYIVFSSLDALKLLRVTEKEEEDGVGLKGMSFETLPFWTDYEKLAKTAEKEKRLSAQIGHTEAQLKRQMTNVSHQVIAPLSGAIGMLAAILRSLTAASPSDTSVAGSLRRRVESASDFAELAAFRVRNMDLLGRLEEKVTHLRNRKPLSLGDVATETARLFRFLAEAKDIEIECEVEAGSFKIKGNEELVKQAVMNLLDNAVYYADPGQKVRLWLTTAGGRGFNVHVSNRGLAIPEEERRKLFDRAFRGKRAATKRPDGTGVGLYLVQRIAAIHGGTVELVPHKDDEKLIEFRLGLRRG